jgi:asparagine synthase (glutamine-hydrolysing)
MCGIAGIVSARRDLDAQAVVAALSHRGPDGAGVVTAPSGACTLIHTRLAIVDPHDRARQPMCSPDRRYWITYNGEVYNHRRIRSELGSDIEWRTESDTETVLHSFMRWGPGCARRLRGMFAFAVWDDEQRTLFLARDPLGIKPLLYGCTADGGLAFGSELRTIVRMGAVKPTVDLVAVAEMIRQGAIRQPRTLLNEVKMLPAGHYGGFAGGNPSLTRYWDPMAFVRTQADSLSYPDAVERVRAAAEDAARVHAMSDVPIGAFLSGGVDSRLVVGMMQRLSSKPIQTFTIGFGEADERADARAAARDLGTAHCEQVVTEDSWPDLLDRFLDAIDQPSIDGFNTLAVSILASPHVKVALSGLGADELFAGYPHFGVFLDSTRLPFHAPQFVRESLRKMARHRGLSRLWLVSRLLERPDRFLHSMRLGESASTLQDRLRLEPAIIGCVESEAARAAARVLAEQTDAVNHMSLYEIESYLRDTLLRDVDVVSMHSGLEVRPVLLDTPFVELALSLPGSYKLRDGRRKAILTDAFPDLLPPAVLCRPKTGFHVPAADWTPRTCADLWRSAFDSHAANQLLTDRFRRRAIGASADGRAARQDEWAAFVMLEVMRRQGLSV